LHYAERVRSKIQQQQEENLNGGDDDRGVSEKADISLVP
jgi:hypothetical protein